MTRNVIVTGGGTGIGRAVTATFAAQGDSVVITGRRVEPLDRERSNQRRSRKLYSQSIALPSHGAGSAAVRWRLPIGLSSAWRMTSVDGSPINS